MVRGKALSDLDPLRGRLACPHCRVLVTATIPLQSGRDSGGGMDGKFRCTSCGTEYPAADCGRASIPWMFPDPGLAHLEWSARFRGFLQSVTDEHNQLNRALQNGRLSALGRQRINGALQAKRTFSQQVSELLGTIGLNSDNLVPAMTQLLADGVPGSQSLLSYVNNVFRDWAWDNGENEALFGGIDGLLASDGRDSPGVVLTLGAGAGRLAYDIHQNHSPGASILLDLNPLLLLAGARVVQGDTLHLHEFPIAPIDEQSVAVSHCCQSPDAIDVSQHGSFRFILGDAMRPPFVDGCVDTIITPWLIDILPQDLREFLPQLNRLLPVGGLWLNTGSLVFSNTDPCRQYSEKEVLEIVENCGFELTGIDHRTIPYLQSPRSAHGRTERIVSFTACKRHDVQLPQPKNRVPEWLTDTGLSVPTKMEYAVASSTHLLTAQVLAAIDGKRSVDAITEMVAREYSLPEDECSLAVRRILSEIR